MIKKVKILQNNEDWLRWRAEGIGASDTPIILGLSKYKTRKKLLIEKAKRIIEEKKYNHIQELGHKSEERHRELLEFNLGLPFFGLEIESPVLEHPKYSYLRASIDGYIPSDRFKVPRIIEMKFTGTKKYEMICSGKCPDDFYAQVQHQLFVSGFDKAWLLAVVLPQISKEYDKEQSVSLIIKEDRNFQFKMFKELKKFWNEVLEKRKEYGVVS